MGLPMVRYYFIITKKMQCKNCKMKRHGVDC